METIRSGPALSHMSRVMLLLLAAVTLAAVPASARPGTKIPNEVRHYLHELGKEGFSGTILVAHGDAVLTRSFGYAEREFSIPNSSETRFRIASLTKQFTAAAMLLLVKDGKLTLDDPLCRHIQPCPEAWRPIVIRQLLDHSSGIPDFVRLPGVQDRFVDRWSIDEIVQLLRSQPLDFPPGSDARYGNSGYLLSAHLIERLSGMRYADFLDQRIYKPLGMSSSGYAADAPIIPLRARGYVRRDGRLENAEYIDMSIPIGAGSQYSTVGDLYRWHRALLTDALLPAALREEMFRPGKGGHALGWDVDRNRGRLVTEHIGDINGFGSFIARWPEEDAVVVVLTNIEGTKVRTIRDRIEHFLFTR